MKQDVENCRRCGGNHFDVEFENFERPIMSDVLNWGWESWATCPTNGDPIIKSASWATATPAPGHWQWVEDKT